MPAEFTNREKARISSLLGRSLGPEFLSVRPGASRTELTYLEGWMVIDLANSIFGFDGWSSEIREMKAEYSDESGGRMSVGYSCLCRVTLRDGTYKEDIGFGAARNQQKEEAIEKAKKSASTDGLKRALRQFGRALGNCVYDKKYLSEYKKKRGLLCRSELSGKKKAREGSIEAIEEESSMEFATEVDLSGV